MSVISSLAMTSKLCTRDSHRDAQAFLRLTFRKGNPRKKRKENDHDEGLYWEERKLARANPGCPPAPLNTIEIFNPCLLNHGFDPFCRQYSIDHPIFVLLTVWLIR
jgi:hypothetical protein